MHLSACYQVYYLSLHAGVLSALLKLLGVGRYMWQSLLQVFSLKLQRI